MSVAWAQATLSWGAAMFAWSALLLALGLLADLALGAKVKPAWRMLFYAPVALRLALPLHWQTPLALAPKEWVVQASAVPPAPANWAWLALSVWVAGAVWLLLRRAVAWGQMRRLLQDSAPRGQHQGVPVYAHPSAGPLVSGLWRPVIVVPGDLDGAQMDEVLAHEAMHLRRKDPWLAEILALSLALLWPLAPLWAVQRRLHQLMELATDDAVTQERDPVAYAQALIAVASVPSAPLGVPALGASGGLRERIEALRDRKHLPALAQTGLVVALSAVALSAAARPPSAAPPASPFNDNTGVAVLFAELPEEALREVEFAAPLCRGAQDWEDGGQLRLLTADEAPTFVEELRLAGASATGANTLLLQEGIKTAVVSPPGVLGDLGDTVRVSLLEQAEQLRVGVELTHLSDARMGLVEQTALPLQDVSMAALVLPADPKLPGLRRLVLVYASDDADSLSTALPWQDQLGVTPVSLGESELW